MFERSEFINFPDLSAFYGVLGGKSFGTFLFAEKYEETFLKPYFLYKKWRWGDSHPRPNIFS